MEQADRSQMVGVWGTGTDQQKNIYAYMHSQWTQATMW